MTATPRVPATDLMSVEAARALTDQIRDDAKMLWAKIVGAYTGRVWQIGGCGMCGSSSALAVGAKETAAATAAGRR